MSYELKGLLFEDRQTVANALNDKSLSDAEKQKIVAEHNWKNLDNMSTDPDKNLMLCGVTADTVSTYFTSSNRSSSVYESNSTKLSRIKDEREQMYNQNKDLLRKGKRAKSPFWALLISIIFGGVFYFVATIAEWDMPEIFDLGKIEFFIAATLVLYMFLKIIWFALKCIRISKMGRAKFKKYKAISKELSNYDKKIRDLKNKIKEETRAVPEESCACNGTGGCY